MMREMSYLFRGSRAAWGLKDMKRSPADYITDRSEIKI